MSSSWTIGAGGGRVGRISDEGVAIPAAPVLEEVPFLET